MIFIKDRREKILNFISLSIGYFLIFIPQVIFYAVNYDISEPPAIFLSSPYSDSIWVDGPSKYIQECFKQTGDYGSTIFCAISKEKLPLIINSFVQNIKELSQAIFSIDSFPLFLCLIPSMGFLLKLKDKKYIDLLFYTNALVLSSMAYLLFEIEIRYTLYSSVGLSLYSIFAINNIKKLNLLRPVFKYILAILFLTSYFYLIFSNSIY